MIRKIIALGKYSGVMVLPKELLKQLGCKKGQKVKVQAKGKSIRVKGLQEKKIMA